MRWYRGFIDEVKENGTLAGMVSGRCHIRRDGLW